MSKFKQQNEKTNIALITFFLKIVLFILIILQINTSFAQEKSLKHGNIHKDCDNCPSMIVLKGGTFRMGSYRQSKYERPSFNVTIKTFAVGRFEVTFDEWDTCVKDGGCPYIPSDQNWGRGKRPVINVSWDDTQDYIKWLSSKTGSQYRLLTEAEWEYAASGGKYSKYFWGNNVGVNKANCHGCGSQWNKKTAPAASFKPNQFGIFDMNGNVWEWVEDCWNKTLKGAPTDGSAWLASGDCFRRVIRGGSWFNSSSSIRTRSRGGSKKFQRSFIAGFRVAKTIQEE